ncbi:MAG: arginine N-succinyltransferase [Pseudomonadota bacterium]
MSFVIRPATLADLQPMYEMAKLTGGGFTNLPPDKAALRAKLERTAAAFAGEPTNADSGGHDQLFVLMLENRNTGEIRGTCQIFTEVGVRWPFYSYRIGSISQHSAELNRTFRADTLSLVTDLEGSSEVGGLFLHPNERAGGLGLLLARSRYLFIRANRERFGERILAELRGVIDDAGGSPFWDGVAGKFFGMGFDEADQFNALNGNQFIADLMPSHPVYVAMLTDAARAVIGVPHPSGRAAMRMLENEGFAFENYIDIFDGGPTMTARTDQVKTIRDAQSATLTFIGHGGTRSLVATGKAADFRCCFAHVAAHDDGIMIEPEAAEALGVSVGDTLDWIGC